TARGIRLGIVSNAHSGRAHRTILDDLGLGDAFGVQIYSDEVGIRKPHPGMIHLATEALGVQPAEAWYVGDTLDRDVVAGRRAAVGAVVITRDRRTDHPPFSVAETPDLVLDTPEGLLDPLRAALAGADSATAADDATITTAPNAADAAAGAPSAAHARRALLLDHGGVITWSTANPDRFREIGARIVALSARIGSPIDQAAAERAVEAGWDRHRARKRARDASADPVARHEEIDPAALWGDLVGEGLPEPLRAALRLEAPQLSFALHRAKSVPAPRSARSDPLVPRERHRRRDRLEHHLRPRGAGDPHPLRRGIAARPLRLLRRDRGAQAGPRDLRGRARRPGRGPGRRRLRGRQVPQRRRGRARGRHRHRLPAARRQGRRGAARRRPRRGRRPPRA